MNVRDKIFAAHLEAAKAAITSADASGAKPPGPNPLRHVDDPTHGTVLGPVHGASIVPAPLNQPQQPKPQTRITGGQAPSAYPVPKGSPGSHRDLFAFPYRGPWTGFGKDHA